MSTLTLPGTFTVTLAPKDIPLDEATDTRELTVTFDDPPDDPRAAAAARIRENKLIDPITFRKHWEIAAIDTADDTLARLKRAIAGLDKTTADALGEQTDTPTTTYTLYLYDPADAEWAPGKLVATKPMVDEWRTEYDRLCEQTPVGAADRRIAHEAVVRTVVDRATDPDADTIRTAYDSSFAMHNAFIDTALANLDRVVDHTRRLTA